MQIKLADFIKDTRTGEEIESILRTCVHCGFCNATCPTYELTGDELDGPRGRIYQIKQFVETGTVTSTVQQHLDRCLTCLSCTTTCPSGVEYNRLIDTGRELVEQRIERPLSQILLRGALRRLLPHRARFGAALRLGQAVRPLLPRALKEKIPARRQALNIQPSQHERRMLILQGCVQPALTPRTQDAAVAVFDKLGIELLSAPGEGCCGAVSQHMMEPLEAQGYMRRNIDAWWPFVEDGIEAIVVAASGCGVMVKDYGHHLRNDTVYADKARIISGLCVDPVEVLQGEDCSVLASGDGRKVAFQSPCTLQHGQKLNGSVEAILRAAGFELTPVSNPHLCCGSAGTYSVLQAEISGQLRDNKLKSLQAGEPDVIASANVGCQSHLAGAASVPVVHWLELLAGFDTSGE
ncbi:glycolate oxidase subunit GlcF [Granulosicoccaceae sp. 1_MG-2023]|nr:glycolate oxidase subunit GlcF [Granulosicoccaceae sp. 1_MG-2023]